MVGASPTLFGISWTCVALFFKSGKALTCSATCTFLTFKMTPVAEKPMPPFADN